MVERTSYWTVCSVTIKRNRSVHLYADVTKTRWHPNQEEGKQRSQSEDKANTSGIEA